MAAATIADLTQAAAPTDKRFPVPYFRMKSVSGENLDFIPAPEIQQIVDRLTEQHLQFSHLTSLRIKCLWKQKGGAKNGKVVFGKVEQLAGLAEYFASDVDFVITLAVDNCYKASFTHRQMEALVFHELCHISTDDEEQVILVGHDAEMFRAEIDVYGYWDDSLQEVAKSFRAREAQLPLDLNAARVGAES